MTISRTNFDTFVKYTFKRTDKDAEIAEATQWILNDIADDYPECRETEDVTASLALTQDIATVDISTALTDQYGNRIQKVVLIDSADDNNNETLDEISFDVYLDILPDPSDTDDASKGYPEEYARRGDTLYVYDVPNYTTLSILIYFGKSHPITGDMLFPDDFKDAVVQGILWKIWEMVGQYDKALYHKIQYHGADELSGLKYQKINKYMRKPNMQDVIKPFF